MARILIVDDARFIRGMLAKVVEHAGHQVVGEAGNGFEAISLFESLRPDVVTLDLTMPEMDGIETLHQILRVDPHAKVIVCSAINAREKVMEALKAGAMDFMLKPVQPERVMAALDRVLAAEGSEGAAVSAGAPPAEEPAAAPATSSGPPPLPPDNPDAPKIVPWRKRQEQASATALDE